ncbi:MAG: hypothetical protein EA376_05155 [Phycisphaeraceae bacterium]|nr:MAG: hypothetical protein EA376_05155 [Phycisphaeraceae bacterium]
MSPLEQTPNIESVAEVERLRRIFWQNVVREWLTALPFVAARKPEVMDGRFSILTYAGERIPLKAVHPVFACSIPGAPGADQDLSIAIQCSVFEIHSTTGEVFTLPIHEIRGLHALSNELLSEIEAAVEKQSEKQAEKSDRPFGFAAFQTTSRQRRQRRQSDEESKNHAEKQ